MNEESLTQFLGRFVADLGATVAAGNVVIGDRLGLYRAMMAGPVSPEELASRTGTARRYVEEWLRGQAAGGYVEYNAETGQYWLTEEQSFVLTDPEGPVFAPGAFELAVGALRAQDRIIEAFRTGDGVGWHEHHTDVFTGCERAFKPWYRGSLIDAWLPALNDDVVQKLKAGALVADVGCGHGASTVMMAEAFPNSTFRGVDGHPASIDQARERAKDNDLDGRVTFDVAVAQDFGKLGPEFDLVTTFDSLHDMGDPLGAARHIRESLTPDGTWMIVEPYAGDEVSDNLNPVGRVYYSFSSFLCVPNALSQEGGYSLGAQAGERPIHSLVLDAGFTRFRRVAETPFNIVYEARP
ncbi:SAM-dependent methyltransferase [Kribbella albertanoniae]|uniref:SAM-dependent methyltransferase n=1 Tax=Kribbella albertanoniae TaxID=1266829 RepID=A0A4R4QHL8_9ACTN|nr:SAM-dependent methyltransferase [Kribbella albertanoniae]